MGGLYGLGKIKIPVIALAIGGVLKLILNIILISNPNINIYGATISSIVCQGVAFAICWVALNKYIKMNISFKRNILKPIISALIMGAAAYGTYLLIHHFAGNTVSTLMGIAVRNGSVCGCCTIQ